MVTIILPTASRPRMLRTALESIAEQTARDKISRVFVSENGGNRESESVCEEFPMLPIHYTYREPMPPIEHGRTLIREYLQGDYTAYLHDDDWWTPTHLAHALAALASHPDAAGYGACHFVVSGESSILNCSGNLFPWFGSGYAAMKSIWELSKSNVLMAELLGTIAHYSTMVIPTEMLKKAAYIFDLGNPFDNDRMLLFALSTFGSLLYNPFPQALVRNHGVQDCINYDTDSRNKHMCATTRWMVETNGKSWDVVAKNFSRRVSICPPEAFATLDALAAKQWCIPEIARNLRGGVLV
ncbi:MAG TPA: glycosyltransferase family A protein [Candidatus Methylacidiphilales bacterium]